MNGIGPYLRTHRETLKQQDRRYSLRQVAARVGIEPAYLSKIEREEMPPPGEQTLKKLARDLELDADLLLAMAGKISTDLQAIICKRPQLFAQLLRQLKDAPDHALLRVVREITDGDW
ncbi:helix-turn-helix domain-containing protein [Phytohalomonas tamaricis]|uniref:helix-turn-helix domain-containing protein n=1 Tax=Phytohalomonas tamaricis TaxID=2081032 RepID=UPI000D0BDFC7|nr:helix-turn-helix transcriptional regulator [Phytohalomonas tamaricis]